MMWGTGRRAIAVAIAASVGLLPVTAEAGGAKHGVSRQTSATEDDATACGLYPIGVKASALRNARPGGLIADLTTGTPSGHEGWLTWAGGVSEGTLATSLTPPGDSDRYVNPDDRSDHVLSPDDWVSARPGAVSSRGVRDALDDLIGDRIVVPVWDAARGTGRNVAYHVTGFVEVELVSYELHHDNRLTAKFHGESDCVAPSEGPVAQPASATTAEDTPTTLTLSGTNDGSSAPLVFALGAPTSGSAALVGVPACDAVARRTTCTQAVRYTPAADYFGAASLTFTVSDGTSASPPAAVSVTVTPVNDPPVPGADSAAAGQGHPLSLDVASLLANDVAGPANEASQHLTVTAVSAGPDTHGTVGLASNIVTYTPDPGFSGTASFTYTTCDDGTTADQPDPRCADGHVGISVSPAPNAPPTGDAGSIEVAEDTSVDLTLTGADPDGDVFTFAIASPPAHGTLTGTAPDLTYTPTADYFGPDAITFTTSDGQATSPPATVAITVTEVNDPPVPAADSVTMPQGQSSLRHRRPLPARQRHTRPGERGRAVADTGRGDGRARHPRHGHARAWRGHVRP